MAGRKEIESGGFSRCDGDKKKELLR